MSLRSITVFLLIVAAMPCLGQGTALDTTKTGLSKADAVALGGIKTSDIKVDFAVPDIPAFRALGVDPTDILRPSDPKTLALMLAERASNLSVVPSSFALEVAPFRLLYGRKLTVERYNAAPVFYNARLSVGSVRTGELGAGSDVAAGIRLTLINDADLLRDPVYRKGAVRLLKQRNALVESCDAVFVTVEGVTLDDIDTIPGLAERQSAYTDSVIAATVDIARGLKPLRDAAKERDWNRTVVDFAYAAKWSSPDSFTRNLALLSHTAWLYGTLRLNSASQGLFGATVAYAREDTTWKLSGAIAARVYGGANNAKVFLQGQVKKAFVDTKVSLAASGGMEILFLGGNWLEFALAYEKEFPGGSKLTPGLKYNITLPESFTKF
jgi:hypothetical protein